MPAAPVLRRATLGGVPWLAAGLGPLGIHRRPEHLARYLTRGPLPLDVVKKVEGGHLRVRAPPDPRTWIVEKSLELDPLLCTACGSVMKIVSVIAEPNVVDAILRHLAKTGGRDSFEGRAPPAA